MDEYGLLQSLFEHTVDLSENERDLYLRAHCPSDALREKVLKLLLIHDHNGTDLDHPASERFRRLLDAPGEQIGDFEIVTELGHGGMSTVFLARDTVLDREVALKILGADRTLSEFAKQRFLHEARAAAGLNHPNIVKIHRYGETERHCFIAMEYVAGGTLTNWLDGLDETTGDGRRAVVGAVASLADALEHAHRAGVIHRDVKPTNVLMDRDGRPLLADFGIARVVDAASPAETLAGAGTASYMSPEQIVAMSDWIDHRSDIFSLGIVLYQALTGRLPFQGRTADEIKSAIKTSEPPKLRSLVRSLPRDLEVACCKALEKRPVDRYPTAAHMAADLRAWLAGERILARPPSTLQELRRQVYTRRHAVAVLGALAGGATVGIYGFKRATDNRALILPEGFGSESKLSFQRVDRASGVLAARTRPGPAARRFRLDPGIYRFTIVSAAGDFAEATRVVAADQRVRLEAPIRPTDQVTKSMAKIDPTVMNFSKADPGYARRVSTLDPFWIDAHEVTCQEYAKFIEETGAEPPLLWNGDLPPDRLTDLPVTAVTWGEARMYAEWAGKRLPTSLEWELAARGAAGHPFPWGNLPDDVATIQSISNSYWPRNELFSSAATSRSKQADIACDARQPVSSDAGTRRTQLRYVCERLRPASSCFKDVVSRGDVNLVHLYANAAEWTETPILIGADGYWFVVQSQGWTRDTRELYRLDSYESSSSDSRLLGLGFRCAKSTKLI